MKFKTFLSSSDPYVCPELSVGTELEGSIRYVGDSMHELTLNGKKYIMEIHETIFTDEKTILISGYVTDNSGVGKFGFEVFS